MQGNTHSADPNRGSCVSYLSSIQGILQLAQIVVGAVCFGVIGYYANEYFYDLGIKTALLFKAISPALMTGKLYVNIGELDAFSALDVWKPVLFFFLTSTVCLINTMCLFIACLISSKTANLISKTVYVFLYHTVAWCLYLSASIIVIVTINKGILTDYREGLYFKPFMAAGVLGGVCLGVIGYYGNEYFYDLGLTFAQFLNSIDPIVNVGEMEINIGKVDVFSELDVWKPVLVFFLTSAVCLINTVCLFIGCLISSKTAELMSKTVYVFLYHIVAWCLYTSASIIIIVSINQGRLREYPEGFYFEAFLAAGVLGAINSVFYLLSIIFSCKSYRASS